MFVAELSPVLLLRRIPIGLRNHPRCADTGGGPLL